MLKYELEVPDREEDQKKTCQEVVQKNRQAHKLNREDAMDCSGCRKQIVDG